MSSSVKALIRSTFGDLTGKSLDDPAGEEMCQLPTGKLQAAFQQIAERCTRETENTAAEIDSLKKELADARHALATLQAEFDSKFEKNKTVSLAIPQQKGGLAVEEEDADSIKSFRPDSDDDSDDIRRKEVELKARKLQKHLHSHHRHHPGGKCCHNHNHNHLYMDTHQQHYGL